MRIPVQAASEAAPQAGPILVWDVPVRVVHWLLVLCFSGAYITAESERWQLLHVTLGYSMGGLIAFRLVWGLVGSRYARFTSFVRGPRAVAHYLASLRTAHPQHFLGHNPAGALAILAMLGLGLAVSASGWLLLAAESEVAEELHEVLANMLLALVLLHIAAVLLSARLHRENLVGAMLHGKKPGPAGQGATRAHAWLGLLVIAAILAFWWLQFQ